MFNKASWNKWYIYTSKYALMQQMENCTSTPVEIVCILLETISCKTGYTNYVLNVLGTLYQTVHI